MHCRRRWLRLGKVAHRGFCFAKRTDDCDAERVLPRPESVAPLLLSVVSMENFVHLAAFALLSTNLSILKEIWSPAYSLCLPKLGVRYCPFSFTAQNHCLGQQMFTIIGQKNVKMLSLNKIHRSIKDRAT